MKPHPSRLMTPLVLSALFAWEVGAQTPPGAINPGTPWPATDGLGRTLPL